APDDFRRVGLGLDRFAPRPRRRVERVDARALFFRGTIERGDSQREERVERVRRRRRVRHAEDLCGAHRIRDEINTLCRNFCGPRRLAGREERREERRHRRHGASVSFGDRVNLRPREVRVGREKIEVKYDGLVAHGGILRRGVQFAARPRAVMKPFFLALLAASACEAAYAYVPVTNATVVAGHIAADYPIPKETPRGDVRLASYGIAELGM